MKVWTLWGHFKQIVSQLSIYFSVYSMIATSMILWRTVIKPVLVEYQLDISVVWFILVLVVLSVIGGLIEWKRSMPGFFRSWTQQFYTPDNPLRQDIEELKKELRDVKDLYGLKGKSQ